MSFGRIELNKLRGVFPFLERDERLALVQILYSFIYLELWFDQTWQPGKIELVK